MSHLPILLVDDEEGIRTVLAITLEDAGYQVQTAPSGTDALELFQAGRHPIVVTDIRMPGMSGVELLREIKRIDPRTEVIMISGHADIDVAIQSLKHDASDFITKPINMDVFTFALQRAEERSTMRRQLEEHTSNLEALVERKSAQLVEVERRAAASQLFEGLTASLEAFAANLDNMSMFNQMPMFVSIHNRNREVVAINDHYRQRLGDLVGQKSWTMFEDLLNGERDCPVARTIADRAARRAEHVVRCVNGNSHAVAVDTVPITASDDEVELVLEFMVDLREAEQLREELRTTQHKYQQLFDQTPCFISVQNRNFTILSSNARHKDGLGDFEGGLCYERIMHRASPCRDCPLIKTFEDGEMHQMETVITNRKGEQINALIWSAPIRDTSGEITEAIEMITDITQIRKLQDRLTSLGLLLGSTAHGIKGLLTGIDGAIYRLGGGLRNKNDARVEDGFSDLQHLTGRMKQTVLDILYSATKRELNWKVIDVATFALNTYTTISAKAEAKNVLLELDLARDLGSFKADASILASALGNILENAIDACNGNEPDAPGNVLFKIIADANQITFQITDNGAGMDHETRDKLFTLFFSSKGIAGTGIGLFVANEIVQQHGGNITVDSEQGHGSTFIVYIPRELSVQV
ncbi:MAG: response regulator [Pseudomonadota bacterium]